ncbi:hypothetical protein GLOIN_2v1767945 [Rhizophagus irregularis DAOM 181602=DAOM 197198]|nr:hypothetical protein GLOIN_2v1767945 [Rhizophagus irregularis DAOM 181602=DAOM 197198]
MFKVFPDILDAARLPDSSDQIRIPREQPWILLLHHLIPRDLTVFFDNYFSKAVDRSRFLLEYVSAFTSELQTITWSPRSRSFKKWEKSLDITLKKKKIIANTQLLFPVGRLHRPLLYLLPLPWFLESYRDNLLFNLDNFSPVQSFLDSLRPHNT